MRKKRNDPKWVDDPGVAERAIILQVLRDDHHVLWTRAELRAEIYDVRPRVLRSALRRLKAEGVIHLDGREVWASRCALYLDELGMVSI